MKVLVVDDERAMLETISRGLQLYGHACLTAINADEACALLSHPRGADVELLITDLTMPGTSGVELINKLHGFRPQLPIVVITGLNSSLDVQAVREMGLPILQKPFDPERLDRTVRAALGRITG